nr:hypothetical protein [Tanacetum cinerariifolium]
MALLEYCTKHNMIAYLEKIIENAQFHEIVDFLSRSSIFYALTPNSYQSSWKPVVITKSSIRGDLLFNDVDGIYCLTNEAIFENLALMGYEGKFLIHIIIHCLSSKRKITHLFPSRSTQAAVAEGEDSGTPTESQLTPSPTQPSGHTSDRAEGSLNLEALYALCSNLSNRVLALETVKDAQAKEILTLKARIKKLEKRCKPRPTKDDSDKLDVELDEHIEYMDTKEALNKERQITVDTARPDVSTARPDDDTARPDVSTAEQELSTAGLTTTPTTSTIFDDDEVTLAHTLIKLKDDKAKCVAFKDSESIDRPARSILTLKPLLTIDPKDKGKGVLEEPELAKKMTKKQEKYTMDERAKLLVEYFEKRKRQLAKERVTAIRNKPPTKTQLIRLMMTYLKNMGRFTHSQLNKKSFEAIQGLYIKEHKLIADFIPIGSKEDERMIRDMNKQDEEESSDKEGIYYRIFRSDGSSRWIKTFSGMVTRFDRRDLVDLYNLVMQRFESTTPEGVDLILLGDLRTMFEANVEDELWQNQEKWSLKKRRYPLTTRTLDKMLSLRLISESASDVAYDLLRFIQKQIDKYRGHDRGEMDR